MKPHWRSRIAGLVWQEPGDPVSAGVLRAEQFFAVRRHTPSLMVANVCNALTFVAAFWATPAFGLAFLWASTVLVSSAYIYIRHRRGRSRPKPTTLSSRAIRRATVNALALGSCWAALPLVFFPNASPDTRFLIACLTAGMLCGGAFTLASIPAAASAFVVPIALASFVTLAMNGDPNHVLAAVVLLVYTAVLLRGVFVYGGQLKARVAAQVGIEQRAQERVQKAQAGGLNAIGGMATSLAHEVNQPLAAAINYLNTARRMLRTPPELRAANVDNVLNNALHEAARAKEIVNHLREFIVRGEPDKTYANLHDIIQEACQIAIPAGSDLKVSLHLEAKDDRVLIDRIQIAQVLTNLLRNAVDAMRTSAKRELSVATSTAADSIKTEIRDTGCGLSEAMMPELFEPFTTTKTGGMGVGLAISRVIIQAHHGSIWAASHSGEGAVFSFLLPLADTGAAENIDAAFTSRKAADRGRGDVWCALAATADRED